MNRTNSAVLLLLTELRVPHFSRFSRSGITVGSRVPHVSRRSRHGCVLLRECLPPQEPSAKRGSPLKPGAISPG